MKLTRLPNRTVLALLLFPAVCVGAPASVDIESAVDLAHGAPPEVAADSLIRIAGADRLPKKRRIELLGDAFALASGAPQPYKRTSGLDHPEGPSAFLTRVYQQELDTQSLQLRAIEGLLPLDPTEARERFQQMPPPELPKLSCDDFLVYDTGRFYEVLGQVAALAFTPKEVREGAHAGFLSRYLGGISSAVQIAPAARILTNAPLNDAEFQLLITSFAAALGRISDDDRSFTYGARQAGPQIVALAAACERRHGSPLVLLQAYRLFLSQNLSAARCAEPPSGGGPDSAVAFFNSNLLVAPLQPLAGSEITAAKHEGEPKGTRWCDSPECQAMRAQYLSLVRRDDGSIYQPLDKEQGPWEAKMRDFLSAMASWTQSTGATPVEHFRELIGFYHDLLPMVPNGSAREFLFRSYVEFLTSSRLPPEDRLEWDFAVTQLVARVSIDADGLGRMAGDLRRANDPVIGLYMALAAIAPQPIAEVMLRL